MPVLIGMRDITDGAAGENGPGPRTTGWVSRSAKHNTQRALATVRGDGAMARFHNGPDLPLVRSNSSMRSSACRSARFSGTLRPSMSSVAE
jgi:hypothetical protein